MPKGLRTIAAFLAVALAISGASPKCSAEGASLKNRKYYVRVALDKGARQYALKTAGAYRIYPGTETIASGKTYMVDIIRGRVAGKTFRLVFDSVPEEQEEKAFELAAAVEKLHKLPIKVARVAGKEGGAARLLVTAGEFKSRSEAQAKGRKLKPSQKWEVYEESLTGLQGRITLRDMAGKTIVADNDSIKLIPVDVEGYHFRVARVSEPKRWRATQIDQARPYRGQIEFAAAPDGTLLAINHIWLEHYLYGVVAAEMGDPAPLEALKTQAVVSRSEIIGKIERAKNGADSLYDFSLAGYDHAYGGKGKETARIKAAVDATVGEILIYQGQAIEAFYSDNCGGMRAGVGEIWGGKEVDCLRGGPDRLRDAGPTDLSGESAARDWTRRSVASFCGPQGGDYPAYAARNYRWVITLKGDRLSQLANAFGGTGKVKDISVARRSRSGRIDRLKIVGDKKTIVIDRDLDIRRALGDLKSSFFTFDLARDKTGHVASMTMYGAGHGHGVGMCQTGAIMMAKQNYPYRQILGHYFQSVLIRRLYA